MTTIERTRLAELLEWAAALGAPSDELREQVRYLLLDHAANALGGLTADSTTAVRRFAATRRGQLPAPGGQRLIEEYAALVQGVSAHALETDDTHQASSSHPGAPIFPAALAVATTEGADFDAFATAVAAGYEVMARVGQAATVPAQYDRGFHPTGTVGVFGAAVAAGRLLGLDAAQLADALGIALSMSAGSMAFLVDGAWTKRLHPGWAAHSGIIAARLAALGFRGPHDPIAGRAGYLDAYSGVHHEAELTEGLDSAPLALFRTSIKAHACCRYKQAPLDAILEIVREHDLASDQVARIRVGILDAGWALVAAPEAEKRAPRSVVDAQFSMPFGAAVAVLRRSAGIGEYTPEVIAAPDVAAMMARVECYRSDDLEAMFPARWPAEVQIELTDGRSFSAHVEFPKGDPENPLTPTELEDKLRGLTAGSLTAEGQARVIAAAWDLGRGTTSQAFAELLGSRDILGPAVLLLD